MTAYRLTTDHSASSHGIPVLVDSGGNAYGPGDTLPDGITAAAWADANLPDSADLAAFLSALCPRPGRPRIYAPGSRSKLTIVLHVDLVDRIDATRGAQSRTSWIDAALRSALDD